MKTLVFILVVFYFISQSLYAQTRTDETRTIVKKEAGDTTHTESVTISKKSDITPRNQMIVVNPLKFFLFYNITYFQKASPSVAIGAGIQVPSLVPIDGYGFNAEVRIYPSQRTLHGFYIAPNISYNYLKNENAETSPFSLGALIGWQWFPGSEFAIGLGIGIDYYFGEISNGEDEFEKYNGKVPVIRFDIGYSWD